MAPEKCMSQKQNIIFHEAVKEVLNYVKIYATLRYTTEKQDFTHWSKLHAIVYRILEV